MGCAQWYTGFEAKGSGCAYFVARSLIGLANQGMSTDNIHAEMLIGRLLAVPEHRTEKQMSQAPVKCSMVLMSLLVAACATPAGLPVSQTGAYSIEVSEGSDRRALALEKAAQICAQETRNPNVIYVLEDLRAVQVRFACEGMHGAAEVAPPRYTLEKGINGLSEN